jgi:hypothetical protein
MLPTPTVAFVSPEPPQADLLSLIRAEYLEMPGLSVTLPQAVRLWNADRRQCLDALEALVRDGFLRRSHDMYLRSTCGRSLMGA